MNANMALEIINLKKTYIDKESKQKVEALKGITLAIKPGSIFGLLGQNGAGKTTIIAAITTLEKPTSGEVKVFGDSVITSPLKTKMNVGVVHQEAINTGFFDLNEILDFQSGYYGLYKNKERCDYLLNKMSLWEHRHKKTRQLSGGMKRRLMIAKALVHSPKLLLLDEPTAGVDVGLRESLWKFVTELKSDGLSILLTTHYLEEAEQLCDQVAIIHKGVVLFDGRTADVISKYELKKFKILLKDGTRREFEVLTQMNLSEALAMKGIQLNDVQDIKIEEGSLEKAFAKMVEV